MKVINRLLKSAFLLSIVFSSAGRLGAMDGSFVEKVRAAKAKTSRKYVDSCPEGKTPNNSLYCYAGIGKDKFGKDKLSGWLYFSPPGENNVSYYDTEPYRLIKNGISGRYITTHTVNRIYQEPTAGSSGYSYQSGPTRTNCYDNRIVTGSYGYGSSSSRIGGSINCRTDSGRITHVPGRGSTEAYVRESRIDVIIDCSRARFAAIMNGNKNHVFVKWTPMAQVSKVLGSSDIVEASFLYSCKEINQLSKSMLYSFDDSDSELSELTNEGINNN